MVFSKPDRVGLWFYQLASLLPRGLFYLLHLRLQDVRQLDKGSLLVFRVVEMWSQHVLGIHMWTKELTHLLVFHSYYHSKIYDVRDTVSQRIQRIT